MDNHIISGSPFTDPQAANSEWQHAQDFGVLAAKAIIDTARNFLNERLEALAEMHRPNSDTR